MRRTDEVNCRASRQQASEGVGAPATVAENAALAWPMAESACVRR